MISQPTAMYPWGGCGTPLSINWFGFQISAKRGGVEKDGAIDRGSG
jgi:hypothetical protein